MARDDSYYNKEEESTTALNKNYGDDGLYPALIATTEGGSSTPVATTPSVTGWRRYWNIHLFNVIMMGTAFCVVFSAFSTTQNFMTTIYGNKGFASLAILYAVFALFNFVAPAIEDVIGPRVCMFLGAIPYSLFVLSSVKYYTWTNYTASFLLGLGAATIWVAQGDYLTRCAGQGNIGLYSGIFFGIFQLNNIVGNALAAILQEFHVSDSVIFLTLFIISVVGVLMLIILRPEKKHEDLNAKVSDGGVPKNQLREFGLSMWATVKMLVNIRFVLIIALILYSGYSQSYFFGVMTKQMTKNWLPWVMSAFGATETIGSIVLGKLSDVLGRRLALCLTFLFQATGIAFSFFIDKYQPYFFFLTACTFGFGDSGVNTQMYALVGYLFQTQTAPAFAALKFIQSLSMTGGLVSGIVFEKNLTIIVYIMIGILALAALCLVVLDLCVEPVDASRRKKKADAYQEVVDPYQQENSGYGAVNESGPKV
eukprot:GEZU01007911.1.p1 GENE.GEZU01007911.1~~GEZU01007911.1.p1  ORF type:complete len:481 (+),score=140.46 GEZU01007911.1:134-1576(+)